MFYPSIAAYPARGFLPAACPLYAELVVRVRYVGEVREYAMVDTPRCSRRRGHALVRGDTRGGSSTPSHVATSAPIKATVSARSDSGQRKTQARQTSMPIPAARVRHVVGVWGLSCGFMAVATTRRSENRQRVSRHLR